MALRTSRHGARVCLVLLFVTGLPTQPISQQITYAYDALGRLTIAALPEGIAQCAYDAIGNILRITTRRERA